MDVHRDSDSEHHENVSTPSNGGNSSSHAHLALHRHRLVDRQGEFRQSRGNIHVRKKIKRSYWRSLYGSDLFHTLINAPTARTVCILLFAYFLVVVVFAAIFYFISMTYDCNMGLGTFIDAFMFSLETMATVGYGTKDIFFDDCYLPAIFLTLQLLVRVFADAVVIGVIYARLSRPTTRASTILFSDKSVIRRIRGKLYFMLQLCELREHQLVEAHARLYVVKKETHGSNSNSTEAAAAASASSGKATLNGRNYFHIGHMRLNHPNDDLGGMLFMCLPQVVVHELDASSPLMPPPVWAGKRDTSVTSAAPAPGQSAVGAADPDQSHIDTTGPVLHRWRPPTYDFAVEAETVPGTGTGTGGNSYNKKIISDLGFPSISTRNPYATAGSGTSSDAAAESGGLDEHAAFFNAYDDSSVTTAGDQCEGGGRETARQREEKHMVQSYMLDRSMEVIAVVEGVDSATGGNVQCRHSYVFSEVQWDQTFTPCVYEGEEAGVPIVDFDLFHKLQPVSRDASFPGNVSSML